MRKLFRDKGTGEFLCANGEWTPDMKLACDFLHNDQVELAQRARGLREVEWLYAFGDGHTTTRDFTVEIPPPSFAVCLDWKSSFVSEVHGPSSAGWRHSQAERRACPFTEGRIMI
jgi:hypothetical protein